MKSVETYFPANKTDWRQWLELNHKTKEAVWVVFYKKNAPNHNLSWSDSVDEALCFGWIDSTKRSIDSEKFMQYFSKRKAKSNWSKINKAKVKTLIEEGLMTAEGYKSIEVAKENGSWTILDDVEALVLPPDLKEALSNSNRAVAFYENLSKSAKKILLHWVISAKRPETRQKRIVEIVDNAQENLKPKQFR
ncbi:MAG: YdeI/OmpD-associated family protein [Putridiphycobacter sp.]|nr:YdeI/OmpD-associated family protein [Putridiphycobacter sp.]